MNKRLLILSIAVLALIPLAGCHVTSGSVRRTLEITSEPTGALVRVNGETHGRTPVSVPFLWYWYHDVEVVKAGYETRKVREYLATPPYMHIPFDFFWELQPFVIKDQRYRHYFLDPKQDY